MTPRTIVGLAMLLVGSLILGWYAGGWAFSLFEKTVPAGAVTDLVRSGTRTAYRTGGIFLGLLIFLWVAFAAWLSRFFRANGGKASPMPPAR